MNAGLREHGYRLAAELLLHPQDRDHGVIERARDALAGAHGDVRQPLETFCGAERAWSEDEYTQTLELSPPCPLYLGAYLFEEPKSCRGAGMSGRNGYMMELLGVYRHFGLEPEHREMPDFLPLMVDFLAASLELHVRDDIGLRRRFVERYVQPGLPPLRERLVQYDSVYAHAVQSLEALVQHDLAAMADEPCWEPTRQESTNRRRTRLPVVPEGEVSQ